MELQLARNPKRFFRREGLIERSWPVRVEVVENDPNQLGVRITLIDQPLHLLREVLSGSPVLRQNLIPTPNASHWSHITPVNMLYPVFQAIETKGG
jgi:hypothetical protein